MADVARTVHLEGDDRKALWWANYPRAVDEKDTLGRIMGPNAMNEFLVANEITYHEDGSSRVGFAIASIHDMKKELGLPEEMEFEEESA